MNRVLGRFLNLNLTGKGKKFNEIKLIEIVISIIFIIFGIVSLSNKSMSDNSMAIFLGVLILLKAILNIYSFITPNSNSLFRKNIIFGILYFVIAILFFTNFIKFINYIVIYFGAFLIVAGMKKMATSITLKIVKENSFLIVFMTAILMFALGGLLMFYPFTSFTVIDIISIFAILYGILNISVSNLLRNKVSDFISKVDND